MSTRSVHAQPKLPCARMSVRAQLATLFADAGEEIEVDRARAPRKHPIGAEGQYIAASWCIENFEWGGSLVKLASVFLSHASIDKDFVAEIGDELGRRGVASWLDRDKVIAGDDLLALFRRAIPYQTVVAVMLTERSAASDWVADELRAAFDSGASSRVIPICEGNPLDIIRKHPFLSSKLIHADGRRVTEDYVDLSACPKGQKKSAFAAEQIARAVYTRLGTAAAAEISIGFDQRGHGLRGRGPIVPTPIERLEAPVLVFRPDGRDRKDSEVLRDDEWEAMARDVLWALAEALGSRRDGQRSAYLFGDAQLGLPFLVGLRFFDRKQRMRVFSRNPEDDKVFSFDFLRDTLPPGDPSRAKEEIPLGSTQEIALYIGKTTYAKTVRDYVQRKLPGRALVSLHHDEGMEPTEAIQLIADVVETLKKWQTEHDIHTAYLFVDLPVAVMPLLGAHLTNVLNGGIHFMEYRRDIQGVRPAPKPHEWYVELKMRNLS